METVAIKTLPNYPPSPGSHFKLFLAESCHGVLSKASGVAHQKPAESRQPHSCRGGLFLFPPGDESTLATAAYKEHTDYGSSAIRRYKLSRSSIASGRRNPELKGAVPQSYPLPKYRLKHDSSHFTLVSSAKRPLRLGLRR